MPSVPILQPARIQALQAHAWTASNESELRGLARKAWRQASATIHCVHLHVAPRTGPQVFAGGRGGRWVRRRRSADGHPRWPQGDRMRGAAQVIAGGHRMNAHVTLRR